MATKPAQLPFHIVCGTHKKNTKKNTLCHCLSLKRPLRLSADYQRNTNGSGTLPTGRGKEKGRLL